MLISNYSYLWKAFLFSFSLATIAYFSPQDTCLAFADCMKLYRQTVDVLREQIKKPHAFNLSLNIYHCPQSRIVCFTLIYLSCI